MKIHNALNRLINEKTQNRLYKLKISGIEEELKTVTDAMAASDSCFDEVLDPSLTDALIYERAALESRYSFLMGELRRLTKKKSRDP